MLVTNSIRKEEIRAKNSEVIDKSEKEEKLSK